MKKLFLMLVLGSSFLFANEHLFNVDDLLSVKAQQEIIEQNEIYNPEVLTVNQVLNPEQDILVSGTSVITVERKPPCVPEPKSLLILGFGLMVISIGGKKILKNES